MKKRLSSVDKFYIDSNRATENAEAMAKKIGCSPNTVNNYMTKMPPPVPTPEIPKEESYKSDLDGQNVAKAVPLHRDGMTMHSEASARYADEIAKNHPTANKEWLESMKNSICPC